MAIYAIGDVQGCYTELCRLLEKINYDPSTDTLWFCGDLVNRGPDSLETLKLVKSLGSSAITVLGNHDLHLLALYHSGKKIPQDDYLFALLDSPDCDNLIAWLQARPLLHYDASLQTLLVHAGIHPSWDLDKTISLAQELETVLRGEQSRDFFEHMYGDSPADWSDDLQAVQRLRCLTNIFTRMRFFNGQNQLNFIANGSPSQHSGEGLTPWFECPSALAPPTRVLFGHWSTLKLGCYGRYTALDGGCVWGGRLAALRIDKQTDDWFYCQCADSKSD